MLFVSVEVGGEVEVCGRTGHNIKISVPIVIVSRIL